MGRKWFILIALLALAYASTGLALIRPGERAVVRRFGRVLPEKPGPGLWVGLPWGMDRVDRVSIGLVRRLEVGYQPEGDTVVGQYLTGDHNLVNVRVVLDYAVQPDDDAIVAYVLNQDRADLLVSRTAASYLAEWVAARTIDRLLLRGKTELPTALKRDLPRRLGHYHLGIRLQDISVAHLLPPDEVKSAFDEVTRAQTAIQTSEYRAQQSAARAIREAEGRKYTRLQQALAYADEQHRLAVADDGRFEERGQHYERLLLHNPNALAAILWDEISTLLGRMKDTGRLDLLDHHLAADGLDITSAPALPRKR
jgi:membrane protease subunit HflK